MCFSMSLRNRRVARGRFSSPSEAGFRKKKVLEIAEWERERVSQPRCLPSTFSTRRDMFL